MNFNQLHYPFSIQLAVEIHKTLSELPAKQTRGLLNAIDAEMAAHQKKCDAEAAEAEAVAKAAPKPIDD